MEEWMDELVETMDDYIDFLSEISLYIMKFITAVFVLITLPIWYLPYKFFRKK